MPDPLRLGGAEASQRPGKQKDLPVQTLKPRRDSWGEILHIIQLSDYPFYTDDENEAQGGRDLHTESPGNQELRPKHSFVSKTVSDPTAPLHN